METTGPKNIDEYISAFPPQVQERLTAIRNLVKSIAMEATEVISYQMPAFKLNGILIYFAAHKNHIGFYPGVAAIEVHKAELKGYKLSKGTVQFNHNAPLPLSLIEKLIRFKLMENMAKANKKKK